SYLELRQLKEAEKDFKKAIELEGNLQTPHLNLALLELAQAFKNSEYQSACQRGIAETDKALRLGPEYADLHYTKARLYVRAATQDAAMKKHALDNLE